MGEVRVVGIRVEQPQNQPVLLLQEANGDRYLPMHRRSRSSSRASRRLGR
jgi:bifunctional DNase/RNase